MKVKSKFSWDAVVVGSGMAGLGVVLGLAKRQQKVLLISKRLKGESTPAAGGILDPFLEMTPGHPLFKLSRAALLRYPAMVREIEKISGLKTGYLKTGMLYLAMNSAEVKELRRRWAWQKKTGLPIKLLSKKVILKKYPGVHPGVLEGLFYPSVARVNPRKLKVALLGYAKKKGVRVQWVNGDPKLWLKTGKVAGVSVDGKMFKTGKAVNATGSWAGSSGALGGKLAILPARGQIAVLRGSSKINTILHSFDGGYIVPWNDGRLSGQRYEYLVGSNVEFAGYKPKTTSKAIHDILLKNQRIYPGLRAFRLANQWAGLRPFPRGKRPLMGATHPPGLFLAAGYYRSGILIGVFAGDLIAREMVSGKSPAMIKPFSPKKKHENI